MPKSNNFIIIDWAYNRISNKEFRTFDDGWEYILGTLTDKLNLTEEDYQEYYVITEQEYSHGKI